MDLIFVRWGIGFLFAALVLSISAISFPLLLDRDVGAAVAMHTSLRVMAANPLPMALWGLIVAALLVIGSIPFFVGLDGGIAGARTCDLAPVSAYGRTGLQSARGLPAAASNVRAVRPPISLLRCCRPIGGRHSTLSLGSPQRGISRASETRRTVY